MNSVSEHLDGIGGWKVMGIVIVSCALAAVVSMGVVTGTSVVVFD